MIVIKRKQATVIGLALLVCVAGYANLSYKKTNAEISEKNPIGSVQLVDEGDYLAEARLSREDGRAGSIEVLNEIIYDEQSDDSAIAAAQEEVQKMALRTGVENEIEALVRAQGYLDAMVYISDSGVNVIVKSDKKLTSENVAQIVSIVQEKTSVEPNNIKVIEAA